MSSSGFGASVGQAVGCFAFGQSADPAEDVGAPSRSPRQPTAIRVNQQASTEIVSKRAGRRSDDRRTSSSPGLLRSPPTRPGPASSLTWCLVILVAPTGRSRTSVPGTVPSMFGDHPAGLTGSRPYSAPHYPDYLAGHIRPCWPNHPEARWELAWLHQCGLSPIKPNELAARRCRQARPVGSRCHTQAWLSYGPLRPGLPAKCALQPLHPANRTRGLRLRASHDWQQTRCQPRSARPSRATQVRPWTLAKTMNTLSQVRHRTTVPGRLQVHRELGNRSGSAPRSRRRCRRRSPPARRPRAADRR